MLRNKEPRDKRIITGHDFITEEKEEVTGWRLVFGYFGIFLCVIGVDLDAVDHADFLSRREQQFCRFLASWPHLFYLWPIAFSFHLPEKAREIDYH